MVGRCSADGGPDGVQRLEVRDGRRWLEAVGVSWFPEMQRAMEAGREVWRE